MRQQSLEYGEQRTRAEISAILHRIFITLLDRKACEYRLLTFAGEFSGVRKSLNKSGFEGDGLQVVRRGPKIIVAL
jgi:hypothetical protein